MSTLTKSRDAVKHLRKAKMGAHEYNRGPLGADILALRVGRLPAKKVDGIRLWAGTAELEITDVDTKERQAVMAADEDTRTITQTYTVTFNYDRFIAISKTEQLRRQARREFPVTVPGRPPFKIDKDRHVPRENESFYSSEVHSITATMTVPKTEMTLLLGIDESSHFISALPQRIETVQEAHEVLRPDIVPEGSPRQGEWFFVPAAPEEIDALYRHMADTSVEVAKKNTRSAVWAKQGPRVARWSMEQGSSHHAMVITVPDVGRFTIGIVKDRRDGHHKELRFDSWHKVVRNTEVVIREPQTPQERQRARYWD